MRRLVVISRKSKLIATFVAIAFSLTSIHLAAKAHIASLQREQQQLEQSAITAAIGAHSGHSICGKPASSPALGKSGSCRSELTAPKSKPAQISAAPAAIEQRTQLPSARSLSALPTANWPSSIMARY